MPIKIPAKKILRKQKMCLEWIFFNTDEAEREYRQSLKVESISKKVDMAAMWIKGILKNPIIIKGLHYFVMKRNRLPILSRLKIITKKSKTIKMHWK